MDFDLREVERAGRQAMDSGEWEGYEKNWLLNAYVAATGRQDLSVEQIGFMLDHQLQSRWAPPTDALAKCLICGHSRPWGIFDQRTGATVCVECRDKARRP